MNNTLKTIGLALICAICAVGGALSGGALKKVGGEMINNFLQKGDE